MAYHPWIIVSGILGNILSFMVYLAPLPTFVRVYRKKSTEGFQSIPYVVAQVRAMLWIYYSTLKSNAYLLMTITSIGCVVETIYIIFFIIYAPNKARILALKLLLLSNFGNLLLILITRFFSKGTSRSHIVGWFCVVSSAGVFAASLSIMRMVIRTKSVEFMPFTLSFFLTLSATIWFIYDLLLKDFYIFFPNIVGVVLGMIQMVLYIVYKKFKNYVENEKKQPAEVVTGKNIASIKASNTDSSLQISGEVEVGGDENRHDPQLEHCHKSMGSTNIDQAKPRSESAV